MKQQILVFSDVYNESAARSQADVEKTGAFGVAAKLKLWDRPKEAEVTLVSSEKRYEPFWNIKASRHVKFDVKTTYTVKATNSYALRSTVLDQQLEIPPNRTLSFAAIEYCEKRVELSEYFPGLKKSAPNKTPPEYVAKFNSQTYVDEGNLVLLPSDTSAAFIAQEIRKRLMEPVEAATLHEDALELHELLLYYRPVYAFEYAWRDKRGVVEIDALTGSVNREGNMLVNKARGIMTRDTLVDIGAELANALVPGGGVIVKLVGAVTKAGE